MATNYKVTILLRVDKIWYDIQLDQEAKNITRTGFDTSLIILDMSYAIKYFYADILV